MPRIAGTRKNRIKTRRDRNRAQTRLIKLAKRAGLIGGGVVFVLWLGAWVVLSDAIPKSFEWSRGQFYTKTAQAGFAVNDILVVGREYTDADTVLALLNVERGDPMFSFDPGEAKALLERLNWVKNAHVERRFPDTVYIELLEHTPLALWQSGGKVKVIDEDGDVLTSEMQPAFESLLIVIGDDAPRATPDMLGQLEAEPEVRERAEAARRVGARRWDILLKNGLTIKMPEEDFGLALRRLADAQERDKLLDKKLQTIDMREKDRIVVRTKPGAVQEYKASLGGDNI